jgi:hypothetical protein
MQQMWQKNAESPIGKEWVSFEGYGLPKFRM